jgi:hypothetical protein
MQMHSAVSVGCSGKKPADLHIGNYSLKKDKLDRFLKLTSSMKHRPWQ